MDKEKATEFVIKELGKHHDRNEIIRALCEQMGGRSPPAKARSLSFLGSACSS